jgi:hypothetical protein
MVLRARWGGFQLQRKPLLKTHETTATATMMLFRTNHLSLFAPYAAPRQPQQLASRFQPRPACIPYESLLARMQPESLGIDMARHGVFWTIYLISPRNAVPKMWQRCPAGSDCGGMAAWRATIERRWSIIDDTPHCVLTLSVVRYPGQSVISARRCTRGIATSAWLAPQVSRLSSFS